MTSLKLVSTSVTTLQTQTSGEAAQITTSLGCIGLTTAFATHVFYPGSVVYEYENQNFWSLTEVLSPSCVFRPTTAQEIGDALRVLEKTDTKFAVRSGGHMGITVRLPPR